MTDDDLAVVRRFAEALPAEPFGGRLLQVVNELVRQQTRAQRVGANPKEHPAARDAAAYILGEPA